MATEIVPIHASLAALDQAQSKAIDLGIAFGPKLLTALLILLAGYYAGRWIGRALDNMLTRLKVDITARQLLVRIAHIVVLAMFTIMTVIGPMPCIRDMQIANTVYAPLKIRNMLSLTS